ncbi:MAG: hypothetical protein WBA13_16165 [Microcoleaceae cyanobacterium]
MGLNRALFCSSLLLISFASLPRSISSELTVSNNIQSIFTTQTNSEGSRSPYHRGSGR